MGSILMSADMANALSQYDTVNQVLEHVAAEIVAMVKVQQRETYVVVRMQHHLEQQVLKAIRHEGYETTISPNGNNGHNCFTIHMKW